MPWSNEQTKAHPDYKIRYQRNNYKRYGIKDVDEAIRLINSIKQCQLCERIDVKLDLDHDHNTGEIRGVLCHLCNKALGMFKDDRALLLKAVAYLDRKVYN